MEQILGAVVEFAKLLVQLIIDILMLFVRFGQDVLGMLR
jgi:hypothetical protein